MAPCNNGKESPWKNSCSARVMEICLPYLAKGPTFTLLWGSVKRILISGFKGETLRLGGKMTPKGLNSKCPSSLQLRNSGR